MWLEVTRERHARRDGRGSLRSTLEMECLFAGYRIYYIKCLFVAICRKIFKLWFLRYKRKVIHRHLCRALAKKVRSLFRIVGYIYSSLSLKPRPLGAARSICLREVSVCCLRSWRDFNRATREFEIPRRWRPARKVKRPLKNICLIKCKWTLFEPNS